MRKEAEDLPTSFIHATLINDLMLAGVREIEGTSLSIRSSQPGWNERHNYSLLTEVIGKEGSEESKAVISQNLPKIL